ncbi:hypothetical protein ACOSOMT5_P0797 [Acidiphilium sp. MT5]
MDGLIDSAYVSSYDAPDIEAAPFGAADVACLYQPIIRLTDGTPASAEILVRRRDQHGVLQGAAEFADALHAGDPARRLTGLVVRSVIGDVATGLLTGLPFLYMLNLPLHILLDPSLPAWIDRALSEANIAPHRLGFELTETRPVENFAEAAAAITALRAQGHHVALDDITETTADLDRLFQLDFNAIKLDCRVIAALDHSWKAHDFVRRIVAACAATGKHLIAEGAEDPSMLSRLRDLGVGYAQGFIIAKPLSAAALRQWFDGWAHNALFPVAL